MKIKISKVSGKYGSPMGRRSYMLSGKTRLQRVRMNGAYDSGGVYWGLGKPLYVAEDEYGNQAFVRANNRQDAKRQIVEDLAKMN